MGFFGDLFGDADVSGYDEATEELESLSSLVDELYEDVCAIAEEVCDSGNAPNDGSATAMENTIGPAAQSVIDEWDNTWPFGADAMTFYDVAMSSHECAMPCFNASFGDAAQAMQAVIKEAQATQVALWILEALI